MSTVETVNQAIKKKISIPRIKMAVNQNRNRRRRFLDHLTKIHLLFQKKKNQQTGLKVLTVIVQIPIRS